ncbi:hypothetical protein GGI43DRAFT_385731 [Trichoderma evansii]
MGSRNSEMGRLAEDIKRQVGIWEEYSRQSGTSLPSVGFETNTPVLSHQIPHSILNARDKIIDSAFELLQLAAGPSKIPSIAITYSQTMMALKWLFHFKIFDHIPEEEEVDGIDYDTLAESANVPVHELKRMLKIATASFIFSVAKMEGATTRWPNSEDSDETARNISLNNDLTFPQYLTEYNQDEGYNSLMKLLGSEPSKQTVFSADIIHGFDWASLPRDSLVVDLGSCSSCSWELAKLFPHLQFQVQGPQDKLNALKEFVTMRNPGLLAQIDFFSHDFRDEQVTHSAAVYLLAGTLENLPDDDVKEILVNITNAMSPTSRLIIATSLRLERYDDGSQVMRRESLCRDMTMRQLQNTGARTIREWEDLLDRGLYVNASARLPGSIITTLVV